MNKIVQLEDYEYAALLKKAEATEAEIKDKAHRLYEKNGTFEINISMRCSDEKDEIFIKPLTYIPEPSGGLNPLISQKDRIRFEKFVHENVEDMLIRVFGKTITNVNLWNKKIDKLHKTRRNFMCLTVTGWAVALVLTLICLFK